MFELKASLSYHILSILKNFMEPSEIKPIYSEQTKAILQEKYIEDKLKLCHEAREREHLVCGSNAVSSNLYVIEQALAMYLRYYERKQKERETNPEHEQLKLIRKLRRSHITDKECLDILNQIEKVKREGVKNE